LFNGHAHGLKNAPGTQKIQAAVSRAKFFGGIQANLLDENPLKEMFRRIGDD
jgi:hypothetical protein